MCTNSWIDIFPYAKLAHLDREWSDHAPIKVRLDNRRRDAGSGKSFRFEQAWVGMDGCEEAVLRGWESGDCLSEAIMSCTNELKGWKGFNVGKVLKQLKRKRAQLAKLNAGGRTTEAVHKRKRLVAEIAQLCWQEEQYWRQRSRALWLQDGDRNTSFFHRFASRRREKNHISKLIDDNGVIREGNEAIEEVALSYFCNLFKSDNPIAFDDILQGVAGRVTDTMNDDLRRDYSEEEVIEALHQIHPLKAPGPDGMNGLFYQTYWHVVGPKVLSTVLQILRGEMSPEEFNRTYIVLIPKKKAPDKMRDLRPISLCNVIYKIVSKVLANRLKAFLGDIVSENQSAFTPGRLITDNVMIAFEVFHYMKNSRSTEGYMAIKLDMAKAYDRVEWVFLERMLRVMGFDELWVDRVMQCVSTISFSVLINGVPSREFRPGRGLRQGDPISPYLFILCAEVLSSLMRKAVEDRALHGVRIATTTPIVSHLLFADDSIFFVKAKGSEARRVKSILAEYAAASGQLINFDKTTVSFSRGVTNQRRSELASILGVAEVNEHARYLGLPTVVGRSKKNITDIIRDKLSKRLQGWRGKTLSRAGREVLVKAVANSFPTYLMSVFKIPINFCDELRRLISRFWWGHDTDTRRITWVAWRQLCKPKSMGGMNFRDYHRVNLALLGKQVWRLMTCADSLWTKLMKAKYFPNTELMKASAGANPSYVWRGIIEAREAVGRGLRRRIGDGLTTSVWRDAWLPKTQSGKIISPCPSGSENLLVANLMEPETREWDEIKVRELFIPFECERILNIKLSTGDYSDAWCWDPEKDGIYTVKSAYKLLVDQDTDVAEQSCFSREQWLWNKVWTVPVWPRIRMFFWQLCNDALATRLNICARGGNVEVWCPLCQAKEESSVHLMRDCRVAQAVWDGLGMETEDEGNCSRVREWVESQWHALRAADYGWFMAACWAIWEMRNRVVFENANLEVDNVICRVRDVMAEMEGYMRNETKGNMRQQTENQGWVAPPSGMVKVNVDAGVKADVGVSTGAVCRNNLGDVLWGLTSTSKRNWEVHVAEAVAVYEGLREASRAGHDEVIIESDCLQVVRTLQGDCQGRSSFFLVIDDIRSLCRSFKSVVWSFTSRLNNTVAHALAHVLLLDVEKHVWCAGLPQVAMKAAIFDLSLMK